LLFYLITFLKFQLASLIFLKYPSKIDVINDVIFPDIKIIFNKPNLQYSRSFLNNAKYRKTANSYSIADGEEKSTFQRPLTFSEASLYIS